MRFVGARFTLRREAVIVMELFESLGHAAGGCRQSRRLKAAEAAEPYLRDALVRSLIASL